MDEQQNSIDKLSMTCAKRAKELNCLYQVEELLTKTHLPLAEIFTRSSSDPRRLPVPRDLPGQDRLRRQDLSKAPN